MSFRGYGLRCNYTVGEAIGLIIIWLILVIVTFGLAAFVLPYYFLKAPINRTVLINQESEVVGRLHVDVDFVSILGHALVWLLLSIITLGLAYLVFWPAVVKRLLNGVVIKDATELE